MANMISVDTVKSLAVTIFTTCFPFIHCVIHIQQVGSCDYAIGHVIHHQQGATLIASKFLSLTCQK